MNKRVLIFSLAYYPSFVSGAEAAVKEITDRQKDITFHMITHLFEKDAKREERIGNVTVHRVGFGGAYLSKILFVPLAAYTARKLHRREKFDGLWAMMTYMLFPLALARFLGVRVPYVLTLQDGDPYEKVFKRWFVRPFGPLLNYGFRHASVIQVISSYLATWPEKRGYTGRIEKIYNGANPNEFSATYSDEELSELKKKYNKQEGDIFLVNTARLVHQKAFDITIRALPLLPEKVKFLVVGGGSDEPMLKELAQELGVSERVIFAGPVERSEVTKYRRISDIFVMPSRSEGLGNAGLSAMAGRLPVIATQEGGLAEYVFDEAHNPDREPTAWVVEKDNPEQIAAAVSDILENPEKVSRITKTARSMVEEKYHWDAVAADMHTRVFNTLWT